MPPSLSPSSIAAFKQCPLAFKFSYVERLPERPSPSASKGTLVHKALELLMRRAPADRTPEAGLADLVTAWTLLQTDPEFADLELTPEAWAEFHASAQQLVLRYFDLEDPTQVNPIGLELKLEARISPLPPVVLGGLLVVPAGLLAAMSGRTIGTPSAPVDTQASAARARSVVMAIERNLGFEPTDGADGATDLVNCPFHELVGQDRQAVCSMNHAFLEAAAHEAGSGREARLEPRDGYCCVRLVRAVNPHVDGPAHPGASSNRNDA